MPSYDIVSRVCEAYEYGVRASFWSDLIQCGGLLALVAAAFAVVIGLIWAANQ